jgi:hypothetical protein
MLDTDKNGTACRRLGFNDMVASKFDCCYIGLTFQLCCRLPIEPPQAAATLPLTLQAAACGG